MRGFRLFLLLLAVVSLSCAAPSRALAGRWQQARPRPALDSLRRRLRQRELPGPRRLQALRDLTDALFEASDPEALQVGKQAVAQAEKLGDWESGFYCLYNVVVYAERFGDYLTAMSYAQKGVTFTEAHQLPNVWLFYQCMGLVAADTKDFEAGVRLLRQAYQLQTREGQVGPRERGSLLLNFANAFLALHQTDSVLFYAARAQPHMRQLGDPRGLAMLHQFKGEVYEEIKPQTAATLDSATANQNAALQIMLRGSYKAQAVGAAVSLANGYRLQGRPLASQQAAELALRLARELHAPRERADALTGLAWAYADQGKARLAYEFDAQASTLRDSLFNGEKAQALADLQVRFDVQRQRQNLRLLAEQNRVVVAQNHAIEAQARAQRASVQVLTQQQRAAESDRQAQRARLAVLSQQSRAATAQAQVQRAGAAADPAAARGRRRAAGPAHPL